MKPKKYGLGIDIGGSFIKYGICSSEGEYLKENSIKTPASAPKEEILESLRKLTGQALEAAEKEGVEISAIGIGTPGSVDVTRGYLKGGTPNFKHWRDVAISGFLAEHFDLPIYADNDANLMAYGEFMYGAGKGKDNVVCITIGTGIGGGIIIDGEIYRGAFFAGSELGHTTIDYQGRPCNCGGTGCWEKYGSATAMIDDYNSENPDSKISNTKKLFERYYEEETAAKKVVANSIVYLGAGLANIINVFNPQMIIVGGGVSEAGDWFIKKIAEAAYQRSMESSREEVEITGAKLGNKAGMLGAVAFALKMMRSSG